MVSELKPDINSPNAGVHPSCYQEPIQLYGGGFSHLMEVYERKLEATQRKYLRIIEPSNDQFRYHTKRHGT